VVETNAALERMSVMLDQVLAEAER
jgi:hypothetical protein